MFCRGVEMVKLCLLEFTDQATVFLTSDFFTNKRCLYFD